MGTIVLKMGSGKSGMTDPIGAALFGATRQAVLRVLFGHADPRFYHGKSSEMIGLGWGAGIGASWTVSLALEF